MDAKRDDSESSASARRGSAPGCRTSASTPRFASFTASARQRSGRRAISSNCVRSCLRQPSVMRTVLPSARRRNAQRGSTDSGAPLTKSALWPEPFDLQSTDIDLRARENSSVARRVHSAARSPP